MKKLLLLLLVLLFVFASCSDDEEEERDKSLDIEIKVGEVYSLPKGTYDIITSPNLFVSTVSNSGEVKGIHDGNTTIVAKNGTTTYNCKVSVRANTTLYVDCASYIGLKKTDIIKIYGNPTGGNKQTYFFNGIGLEKQVLFVFDNNDIVTWSGIDFTTSYAKKIGEHLADRYTLVSSSGGKIMYSNTYDNNDVNRLIITVENNTSVIRITYVKQSTIML